MFDKKVIELPREERSYFYYRTGKIKTLAKQIHSLMSYIDWKQIEIKEPFVIPITMKNTHEDIDENIRKTIEEYTLSQEERTRIYNLYLGMKYISEGQPINPENLKNLYQIISQNLIQIEEKSMGEFYRNEREYVMHYNGILPDFTEAVQPENIDDYMNHYFDYIRKDEESTDIEKFIKSQIIHLYFLYVHPYLDANGRSARLVSSWYLINQNLDNYLLFNKAINEHKEDYSRAVRKSITTKDFTHYLFFIMTALKKELEKMLTINELEEKEKISFSKTEREIIDCLLSIQNKTIKELLEEYMRRHPRENEKEVFIQMVMPLLEKGIIIEVEGHLELGNSDKKKANQYGG